MKEKYFVTNEVVAEAIESNLTKEKKISLFILRLDKIHPIVSGNKLFKLHYFLEDAINTSYKKIITFGGAYSNHLAATAFSGRRFGIKTIGIVRGERPEELSHTLQFCLNQNMHLEFITRQEYANKAEAYFLISLKKKFGEHILIPEGGFSEQGVSGAALISEYFENKNYTHICCAIGTATTFLGIMKNTTTEKIIGFPALKNMNDMGSRIKHTAVNIENKNYELADEYHFGGYAKYSKELVSFMNIFFENHRVPLDFVYTGKMMFGVNDLIKKNYFLPGSKILCIHTGGLQGNHSLPKGMLNF